MSWIDRIVDRNPCPNCGVATGEACTTPFGGRLTDLTHDARVYASLRRLAQEAIR